MSKDESWGADSVYIDYNRSVQIPTSRLCQLVTERTVVGRSLVVRLAVTLHYGVCRDKLKLTQDTWRLLVDLCQTHPGDSLPAQTWKLRRDHTTVRSSAAANARQPTTANGRQRNHARAQPACSLAAATKPCFTASATSDRTRLCRKSTNPSIH